MVGVTLYEGATVLPLISSPDQKGNVRFAITWHLSSSVNFYILTFSETTVSIGTKLGRNVHWKIPFSLFFVVD